VQTHDRSKVFASAIFRVNIVAKDAPVRSFTPRHNFDFTPGVQSSFTPQQFAIYEIFVSASSLLVEP
jgi:hypothetical protein